MTKTNSRPSATSYHISSFLGGTSDYEDKGIRGSFKSGYNLDIRKQIDSLSCGQALTDDLAVGTMTAQAYFVVPASDGNTYFFCYDGKIFRRNSSGVYILVWTDVNESGHIIGACEWYSSAGWTYLLWATPTRLNIKKIAGTGYTQTEPWNDVNVADTGTWPKTNLTSTNWHTMCIANGALQICNGNVMALVGYDLSYTNESLRLIPGNSAKCVLERDKYGVIGCTKTDYKDESAFFTWDGIGLSWNDKKIIKFSRLNSMIDTEIAIAQFGTDGQLYIPDFRSQVPFRQIRGGGESNPDGVTAYHGMALMGIFNNTNEINGVLANGIYSIGRVNNNADIILNLEYQLTCDEIYSVKTVGTDILVVYKLGSQYGVKKVDWSNKSTAVYQSLDLVAPIKNVPLGRMLEWATIDLQCQPLPADCKIECWYKYDKQGDFIQANTDPDNPGSGLQFQGTGNQNAVFYVAQPARVSEVQLVLIPSGNETPEVNEINAYFTGG
jgi:hypothetical protein